MHWIIEHGNIILGWPLLIIGATACLGNVMAVFSNLLFKTTISMVPILGGLLLMSGLILLNIPAPWPLLPLILDPGCAWLFVSFIRAWRAGVFRDEG